MQTKYVFNENRLVQIIAKDLGLQSYEEEFPDEAEKRRIRQALGMLFNEQEINKQKRYF